MALNFQTITTRISPEPIDMTLDIRSEKAAISKYRNDIIRKVSDFISEEMGIGKTGAAMGMAQGGQRKLLQKQFSAVKVPPGAIADALVDPDEFETFTGFRLHEVSVMKDTVLHQLPSAFETKVYGVGEPTPPAITAVSRSLGKTEGNAISKAMGAQTEEKEKDGVKTGKLKIAGGAPQLFGEAAIKMLFTDGFKGVRKQLFLNAKVKFANLLIIDTIDLQKGGQQVFKFVTDPLGNLANNVFTKAEAFGEYFSISIKIKKESKATKADKWRTEIKPKAKLYTDMKKSVRNITNKVKEAHMGAFSQKLLDYLEDNIPEEVQANDINGYLQLVVAFAREFEKGGMTPFIVRSEISREMPTPINTTLKVQMKKRKSKAVQPQKFISGAQITSFVQNRLRKIMPQGPRRGPPLSPVTMTNRTGRFRRSIDVIPIYRANMMKYTYDPIYMSLLDTPYNPDTLITNTIREVVQALFSRQFAVTRGM